MRQHLVSVIVPVYNKREYLEQCVESILSQTYKHLEVLLVDDESSDGSGEICDRYEEKDGRVKAIHQKNGGPTAACAAGMKAAAGGYYMFVDADDYLETEMIAQMAKRLRGTEGEIVCCNYVMEKQRTTQNVRCDAKPGIYEGESLLQLKAGLIGQERRTVSLSRCMKLCEKSLFDGNEKYYDYSLRFGDDANLMYPVLLGAVRVVIMKDAFYYHYRYVSGSLVHSYDKNLYENVRKLMAALSREAEGKKAPGREGALSREHCYMLLYVIKNELRSPGQEYRKRIQAVFLEQNIKALLQNTPITVTDRANQLLYMGMLYPGGMLLRVLRLILRIYDKKK